MARLLVVQEVPRARRGSAVAGKTWRSWAAAVFMQSGQESGLLGFSWYRRYHARGAQAPRRGKRGAAMLRPFSCNPGRSPDCSKWGVAKR